MSTPEPLPPVATLLRHSYNLAPCPAWPRGIAVELTIGRRRKVKKLARSEQGWIGLSFGMVRAAVRIRPAE